MVIHDGGDEIIVLSDACDDQYLLGRIRPASAVGRCSSGKEGGLSGSHVY
jgi:hypothetical protein